MKQTKQLAITGMTCHMCVKHVVRALNGVEGLTVRDVNVGSALVEYDPAAVPEDRIRDAVRDAGYDARVTQ